MIRYIINDKQYLDFYTIKSEIGYSKSHTHKLLQDNNVPYIHYMNKKLYQCKEANDMFVDIKIREMIYKKSITRELIELLNKKIIKEYEKVY